MRNQIIKWLTGIALISGLLWAAGLFWVIQDQFLTGHISKNAPALAKESPVAEGNKPIILAMGDSLTRGTGDPEGKGYAGHLVDSLEQKSKEEIILYNLAIKGQRSADLLKQIKKNQVQAQIKQADLLLITIGGNDLFQRGEALANLDLKSIAKDRESYLNNLNSILTQLRSINPEANIFIIGLYNPFSNLDNAKLTSKIVREWNFQSAEVCAGYPKVVFVPTFDLFELKVQDYLYSDQFHPNAKGYKLIAERVASLITW